MSKTEIDLNPVDFITIGTIGPKGQRVFHLQAGQDNQIYTFLIEKEQAWALAEAIQQLIEEVDERYEQETRVEMVALDMDLREPIQSLFRVAQMGLAWDTDADMAILVAQELVTPVEDNAEMPFEIEQDEDTDSSGGRVVRMWATLKQMLALSLHAMDTVEQGRPSPRLNGRITYYWT